MAIKTKQIRNQNIYDLNIDYNDTSVKNCIKDICDFFETDLLLKKHTTTGQLDQTSITSLEISKILTVTKGNFRTTPLIPYGFKVYELENQTSLTKTYIKFTFGLLHMAFDTSYEQAVSLAINVKLCNSIQSNGEILSSALLSDYTLCSIICTSNDNNIRSNLRQNISGENSIGSYDKINGRLFFQILPGASIEFSHVARKKASTMFGLYIEKHNTATFNNLISYIPLCSGRQADGVIFTTNLSIINNDTAIAYSHNNLLFLPKKNNIAFSNTINAVKSTIVNPTTFEIFQTTSVLVCLPNLFNKLKTITIDVDTYIAVDSNTIGANITTADNTILIKV